MRRVLFAMTAVVLLAGCAKSAVVDQAEGAEALGEVHRALGGPQAAPAAVSSKATVRGSYSPYKEGVIGHGAKIALYFCASWHPFCIRNERMIREWFSSDEAFPLNVYGVEFDATLAEGIKKRFEVTDPDTWVVVDGSGRYYRRIQGANPAQVRDFLLAE